MNEDHIATEQDFEAIGQALAFLRRKELDYIFKDRRLLENTELVTYDSIYTYVIQQNGKSAKTAHDAKISEADKLGWRASVFVPEIRQKLSKNKNYISGPVQSLFITSHQKRKNGNLYTTTESYMATIVHEFGHVYYEKIKNSWFSNYDYNIRLMNLAKDLYSGRNVDLENIEIKLPQHLVGSEAFAFCTEYSAATCFWPNYKKQLDIFGLEIIDKYLNKEMGGKLINETSVLDEEHIGAMVVGKMIMEKLGARWVGFILDKKD